MVLSAIRKFFLRPSSLTFLLPLLTSQFWRYLVKLTLTLRIDIVFIYPSRRGLLLLPAFFLPTERSFVKEVLKPGRGEIFVDIGAYIGRCSLIVARCVGEDGKVISIEAHPRNFDILVKNIKLNGFKNVISVNLALSSQGGLAKLYTGRWHTQHSLRLHSESVSQNGLIVPCKTLDETLEIMGIKRVNLIRVDVVGGELEVLRGGEKTLQNNSQLRLLIQSYFGSEVDILSYLKKKGFNTCIVGFKRQGLPLHIYAVRY